MALDNTEAFSVHLIGDVTGETWTGGFTTKIWLSHRELLRIDQIRRQLLGETPSSPSVRAADTADMLSELQVRLVEAPAFWKDAGNGLDLVDDNLLQEVWAKVQQAVARRVEARTKQARAVQERLRAEAEAKEKPASEAPKETK